MLQGCVTTNNVATNTEKPTCDTEGITCMTIAEAMEGGNDRMPLREFWAGAQKFAALADIDISKRYSPEWRFFYDHDMPNRGRCGFVPLAGTSQPNKHVRINPEINPMFIYTTFLIHEAAHARQREARKIFNPYMEGVNVPEEQRVINAAFLEADARAFTIWAAYSLRDVIPGYWEAFRERKGYEVGSAFLEDMAQNWVLSDDELLAAAWEHIAMIYMVDDYRLVSAVRKIEKDIYVDGEITAFDVNWPADTLQSEAAIEAIRSLGEGIFPGRNVYSYDMIQKYMDSFTRDDYFRAKALHDHARDNGYEFCTLQPDNEPEILYVRNEKSETKVPELSMGGGE